MNWPPIDVPILGRSGLIALIALLHIPFFVNFVMGAPVIAVISEWLGKRTGNPHYDKFSKHLATMAFVTVGVGAFGGIGLVATNIGLFPRFFATGAGIFFWPLVLEIGAFLMEAIGIGIYRYTWEKNKHKTRHFVIGWVAVFGAWLSGFIINGLASFMLTPGKWVESKQILDAWFNPSFWPSFTHRAVAAFSITGFFMIMYALWMARRSKSEEEKSYAEWSLRYAGKWTLISTALQFVPGVWYLTSVERGTSLAAAEGSVVPKLLNGPLTFYWFGGIILAATAILIVYFLSVQYPKQGLKAWGRVGLILSVLLILTTTAFMGFTRERSRKPYLVYGVIYGNQMMVDMMPGGDTISELPPIETESDPIEAGEVVDGDTAPEQTPIEMDGIVDGDAAAGQVVFESGICKACHSLNGEGGSIKALDGIGERRTAENIRDLLNEPPEGMPAFSGTSQEANDLAVFLSGLK